MQSSININKKEKLKQSKKMMTDADLEETGSLNTPEQAHTETAISSMLSMTEQK